MHSPGVSRASEQLLNQMKRSFLPSLPKRRCTIARHLPHLILPMRSPSPPPHHIAPPRKEAQPRLPSGAHPDIRRPLTTRPPDTLLKFITTFQAPQPPATAVRR